MHQQSYDLMARFRRKHFSGYRTVLDVGSYDVNGTYKPLFDSCIYVGVDATAGPNVDFVIGDPPWPDVGIFDVVISGQTLEHVQRPWLVFAEMAKHVRPGGYLAVIAPFVIQEHRYPIDGWRFLPDGMRVLAADAELEVIETGIAAGGDPCGLGTPLHDTYLVARRPSPSSM